MNVNELNEYRKQIRAFCKENGIKKNGSEYFFTIDDKHYRLSMTRVKLTEIETVHLPWVNASKNSIIMIKAPGYRLEEVYMAIKEGRDLKTLKRKKNSTATPVVKPEEKPVAQIKTRVNAKENALNQLLGGKRR